MRHCNSGKNDLELIDELIKELDAKFPEPEIELDYKNEIELLIAVILSAQCTDKRVNKTTVLLFEKYKTLDSYIKTDEGEFAEDIKPCGFYKNKAKNILAALRMLYIDFDSKVPHTMEKLLKLPGVGRKTANLMLGAICNSQTIVVDTHVKRVSNRLGFTTSQNPDKIETDLQEILPKDKWSHIGHQILLHGRYICKARKPECDKCNIYRLCSWDGKL